MTRYPHRGQAAALIAGFVVLVAAGISSHAAGIGINFTGGGNASSPAISLLPTDVAGVVPQSNFNNISGGSGAALALVNNSGAATPATLTFTSSGTYSSIGEPGIAPAGGDEKLNTGFVYGNGSFTVAAVPFARYDVYVYMLNDAPGRIETTSLTAGGPAQTFFGAAATPNDAGHVDQNAATSYVYTQTVSTNSAAATPNGDYVLFAGLTAPSFTFTDTAPGNGYLNGFQVVENLPEPGALGVCAVTGLAALLRRCHCRHA
jgi:hypothetical protein